MARRSLSMQGRILAAGVSVAVGGALVGYMAAGDHTADASQTTTSAGSTSDDGRASATPPGGQSSSNEGFGTPGDDSGFAAQPQTRTGGS